jgi:RimJ/RimL family protein N-acetyltransferase
MNIKGKNVTLRAIEKDDLPILHKWANDPEIWNMLGGWHFPSSMDTMEKLFFNYMHDHLNQRFAIEVSDMGIIGTANLVDIDWKNNHAFHGMMLGDKNIRGKGYGVDAIMAIMRYSFEELHLQRLDGSMIEYNEISLNIYCKKLCWKEEGRQRDWYFRKNKYWDKIIVGVTKKDYLEHIISTNYWGNYG